MEASAASPRCRASGAGAAGVIVDSALGEQVRRAVRERVAQDLRLPGLTLGGVTEEAARVAASWPCPPRQTDWNWRGLVKHRRGGDLDLSIWHGTTLCGLAYGRARAEWLELGWLEGNPHPHPLAGRIRNIALAVLRTQAGILGYAETRLANPIQALRPAYQARGWTDLVEAGSTVYLCRREPLA